jgi:hypothetical protein
VSRAGGRLGKLALLAAAVLLVFGALEATLRWRPTLLGQAFANGALSRYTSWAGGIHYADPALRMHFMIPNHRARMYYNGYVWHHETDALGFRNRVLHVPADVMLLGDSVVYGHGVEFEDTIGHRLEERSGLRTVNTGHQAYCAFQEAYLLTEFLPVFRPRVIVHVFSPNDIDDLYAFLSNAAMERFIATPVERITYPPRTDTARLLAQREGRLRDRPLGRRLEEDLYVMKMFRWLGDRYHQWRPTASIAEAASRRRPEVVDPGADATSLGWRYTAHALAYMKFLADRAGARVLEAPIPNGRQLEVLRSVAAASGLELVDTSALYESPGARLYVGPSFLPGDGHLSPHGARVMAEAIAAHLERTPRPIAHAR